MRIVSWNINGLRSVIKNGGLKKVFSLQPDLICLQEIKLAFDIPTLPSGHLGYHFYHAVSEQKGSYGTAIITRLPVKSVSMSSGFERCDADGRFISMNLANGCIVICLYMPHGKRDMSDVPYKIELANYLINYFRDIIHMPVIIATDFNIAHRDIDLARPRENKRNTMFSNKERELIDKLVSLGYVDAFRKVSEASEQYSWWPYSFNARERNLGWRIDYFFVSLQLASKVRDVTMCREIEGSDHCPVVMDIDWKPEMRGGISC
jgi:exodeoxyribonuclease-3